MTYGLLAIGLIIRDVVWLLHRQTSRVEVVIKVAAVHAVTVLNLVERLDQAQQELLAGFVEGFEDLLVALDDGWNFLDQGDLSTRVLRQAIVALNDVLQEPLGWLCQLVFDHEVKYVRDGEVAFRLHAQVL